MSLPAVCAHSVLIAAPPCGRFVPSQAALNYARKIGPQASTRMAEEAEEAEAPTHRSNPLSAHEAVQAAIAEGLTLVRDFRGASRAFQGIWEMPNGKFACYLKDNLTQYAPEFAIKSRRGGSYSVNAVSVRARYYCTRRVVATSRALGCFGRWLLG